MGADIVALHMFQIYSDALTKGTCKFQSLKSEQYYRLYYLPLLSPSFRNNTYNDLVNTGNIKLLEDREIIDALMTYYTTDFSDWREEYIHRLWREYLPHAIDMLPSEFLEDIVKNDSGSEIKMKLLLPSGRMPRWSFY